MKKVLITGSNGFVGSNIISSLKLNYDVWGLDKNENLRNLEKYIQCDITNPDETKQKLINHEFEYVVHCAAIAHNDQNQFTNKDFINVNQKGTENLLNALKKQKPKLFVFFSTVAVYGEYGQNGLINEESPIHPITDYGKSKMAAEEVVKKCTIPYLILRFPTIYSHEYLKDLKKRVVFIEKFGKRMIFRVGSGSQQNTFCHITNVCSIINSCIDDKVPINTIFQTGDSFNLSASELVGYFKSKENIDWVIGIPKILIKILMFILSIIKRDKNMYRSFYWKLAENNIYSAKRINPFVKIVMDKKKFLHHPNF